jgi:hypothetical protein
MQKAAHVHPWAVFVAVMVFIGYNRGCPTNYLSLQQLCPGEASLARLAFSIALYVFLL